MTVIPTSDALNQTTCMKQIRKLAECINSRDGGMIADIDFDKESNTYIMVITFADGTSQRFEWDTSPLDISNMTGSVSNGNLTVTIFMSNGTSHAFTCPLNGMATESYVDTLDSQNVKKTGTSVVTGDIQVPTTPATPTSVVNSAYVNDASESVNNIVHKTGNEIIDGVKTFNNPITANNTVNSRTTVDATITPSAYQVVSIPIRVGDKNNLQVFEHRISSNTNGNITNNFSLVNRMHENDRADTAILSFSFDNNGYVTLGGEKTVNGVRKFFTIWTDKP